MSIDKLAQQVAASGALSKAEAAKRDKRHKKRARQRAKREKSAAVAAEIWADRDGKRRPTEERRQKGAFVLRDGDDAGVTVAVDEAATCLDRLRIAGRITDEQCQGGQDYAALMERTRMISGGRSCIDFTPVGYDGGGSDHAEARDSRDRAELYLACGMLTWAEMRRVCCDQHEPKDMARLRAGLDICAKFWG